MKMIIVVCLLFVVMAPRTVYAIGCDEFEYAELQDMDQKTLLAAYCTVCRNGKISIDLAVLTGNRQAREDSDSCSKTRNKMERVYMKRFNIDEEEMGRMRRKCQLGG